MLTFFQRMGLVDVRKTIQTNSLDVPTRNAIWDIISPFLHDYARCCSVDTDAWVDLYKKASDTMPTTADRYADSYDNFYQFHREKIITGDRNECFDLVEFLNTAELQHKWGNQIFAKTYQMHKVPKTSAYNAVLEEFAIGHRIIDGRRRITSMTNDEELAAVNVPTPSMQ